MTVIVIDPGHGGENLGAEYESYTEKDMTMIVARSMKEELEKYDDVVVYLTLDADADMSIKDRALFAKDRDADFLYCLHFNMSVNHNLFGAEVWVPAFSDYYVKGYQFAEIEMEQLTTLGLYSRGIKTKLNDRGEDYYGILRYCSANGIPSALIEHCHLDEERDKPFYQKGEEQLKAFGRLDAEAVAKYFNLTSAELGKDFSGYGKAEVETPTEAVKPDKTEPEICKIELLSVNEETGEAFLSMEAFDADSYIQYYNYSLDGGNTYSQLEPWPRPEWNKSERTMTFRVSLPFDKEIQLRTNAYNGFDVWTESNIITIPAISSEKQNKDEEVLGVDEGKENYEEISVSLAPIEEGGRTSGDRLWLMAGIFLIILFFVLITYAMVKLIFSKGKHNKRKKRR